MQRLIDILISGFAMLLIIPLLVPILFFLKLTGEGEVFFSQLRVGRHGKLFKLYKLATMLKNSPTIATGTVTVKDDPRILPAGRFFRKTKINELPQLFNIFIGDMSFIGPRPLTPQTFKSYSPYIQNTIIQVTPGLSGIGSIIFRMEEEILSCDCSSTNFYNGVVAPYKGLLEEWFVKNRSLKTYVIAFLVTGWVVVFPRSSMAWRAFKGLPPPPAELKKLLNYPAK